MAIYRNVQLSFWTDNKVEDEFTPEDKYFYLYLLTNPQTNICGCYEVSYSQMSHNTGYNKDTINRLLERFEKVHGIIRYSKETKEVLILHWYKYNWNKSEKVLIGVENVAKHIKNKEFKNYVLGVVDSIKKETSIVEYQYPIQDIVSDTSGINDSKKRITYKEMFNNLILDFSISDYLLESLNDWICYKKERNFTYKEKGLKTLLKTASDMSNKYGDEAVVNTIRESISNGYQGIIWDKVLKKSTKNFEEERDLVKEWRGS